MRFADDIFLLSESAEHLKKILEELQSKSLAIGLKLNASRSTVMIDEQAERALFNLGNAMLEQIREYNYLGQVFSADPNHKKAIRHRIEMGWGALNKHSQIMKNKLPPLH